VVCDNALFGINGGKSWCDLVGITQATNFSGVLLWSFTLHAGHIPFGVGDDFTALGMNPNSEIPIILCGVELQPTILGAAFVDIKQVAATQPRIIFSILSPAEAFFLIGTAGAGPISISGLAVLDSANTMMTELTPCPTLSNSEKNSPHDPLAESL